MKDYSAKTAYITGGSSGIGLAIAAELVRRGATAVLIARNLEKLEPAREDLQSLTSKKRQTVHLVSVDISKMDQVRDTLSKTVQTYGAPDILVNSAGIAYPNYFQKIPHEKLVDVITINLIGTWNVIRVLEPYMRDKGGTIVNISSMAGLIGLFGYTAYSASKFGVIGLSEALRGELKRYGISVSVLCPPDTDTPQLAEENKTKPAEAKALSGKSKPMSAEAVAKACIRGMEKGKFMIIPGFSGKMIYQAKRLFPSWVNWMMDREIRRVGDARQLRLRNEYFTFDTHHNKETETSKGSMGGEAEIFRKCYNFTEAVEARESGIYPYFKPIEGSRGSRVVIEGRELIMAGSNNYLGLALDPEVREASVRAIEKYGTSCSGSRFMNGTLTLHEELEERLAAFVGKDAALSFTTGYQTNLGAISALVGRGEHVITDKFNHASIMDGIFLTLGLNRQVNIHRFKHNDLNDLEKKLSTIPSEAPKLIVSDGVFSMEGDIARLPELKALSEKYSVGLYLDEAHAIGVIGKTGRGTTEYYGCQNGADLIMCTFSKAFGSIGGFVAGEERVIDYIKHVSRPLIFSASMPPANIAAVMAALDIIEREPQRVTRLQEIARKMIQGFSGMGFNIGKSETAIVPLIIGDNQKTFLFWKNLFDRGVYVNPVISPAVPPNRALIRTSYMATHSDEELDQILEIAGEEGKKLGIV